MSIFTHSDFVGVIDVDKNLNLNGRGIIRMMQEAANLACVESGYDLSNIEKTHRTWILIYWRIRKIKEAKYSSKITIKTWTSFTKGLYSNRKFELYNEENELVAIADSRWIFADTETHSIKKIDDKIISAFAEEEKELFDSDVNTRITLSDNAIKKFEYSPLKRDVDANGHVNNMVFIEIAEEVLEDTTKYNYMTAIYKKELKYGEKVSCYLEEKDKETDVYLYSEDTNTLHTLVTFKKLP